MFMYCTNKTILNLNLNLNTKYILVDLLYHMHPIRNRKEMMICNNAGCIFCFDPVFQVFILHGVRHQFWLKCLPNKAPLANIASWCINETLLNVNEGPQSVCITNNAFQN